MTWDAVADAIGEVFFARRADGTASVDAGYHDIGTGTLTIMPQIAADADALFIHIADAELRRGEAAVGRVGRDDDVAHHGEFAAATQGEAVDGRYDGLVRCLDACEGVLTLLREGLRAGLGMTRDLYGEAAPRERW